MHWASVTSIVLACVVIVAYIVIICVLLTRKTEALNDGQYVMMRDILVNRSASLKGIAAGAAVISLKEQDDARRQCVIDDARAIGIEVEPFVVDRSPHGGIHGCFDSHQRLCKQALKKGLKSFCIFEDDARLTAAVPDGLQHEIKSALAAKDPVIVTMGYIVNPLLKSSPYKNYRHLNHIALPFLPSLSHSHAYCLNEAAMTLIAELDNSGKVHYDWKIYNDKLPIKVLLTNPVLFTQCDCDYTTTVTNNFMHKVVQVSSQARVMHYCNRLSCNAEWHWLFFFFLVLLIIVPKK